MPKPFPWESQPNTDEAYIAVDPLLLETIRQLCCTDKDMQPILRMVMSVAHIDPADGPLVIGVKLTRELEGVSGEDPSPDLTSQQNAQGTEAPPAHADPAVKGGSSRPGCGRRHP